ncbi:MAG TPA: hypothetical protein VK973_08625 [Arenicellales bacterium]|nr:hypothetical protein [Arenicellales bacterium]
MVIHYLHVLGCAVDPSETNPPLSVDTNTELPGTIPFKGFELVARRYAKVIELACDLELPEFPASGPLDVDEAFNAVSQRNLLRIATPE